MTYRRHFAMMKVTHLWENGSQYMLMRLRSGVPLSPALWGWRWWLVLLTINRWSCTITEKAPTRALSWLKKWDGPFPNWFIGLLVYLHDQTGYTTNNYLVSCRISNHVSSRQGFKLWGLSPWQPSLADTCLTLAWAFCVFSFIINTINMRKQEGKYDRHITEIWNY